MDAGKIYNSWPFMGKLHIFQMIMILKSYLNLSAFSDPSLVQFMHRNLAYVICFLFNNILQSL